MCKETEPILVKLIEKMLLRRIYDLTQTAANLPCIWKLAVHRKELSVVNTAYDEHDDLTEQ